MPKLARPEPNDRVTAPPAGSAALDAAALAAALEQIPAPAAVVSAGDLVVHANAAARAELERDRVAFLARARAAARGEPGSGLTATALGARRFPGYRLVVADRPPRDPGPQAAVLAGLWGLTPRQHEVLALLALGRANKAIAVALRCAENTVELHVTGILRKSQAGSRAELIARFWSTAG